MTQKTNAAYAAPQAEELISLQTPLICASIDNVSEEDFDFDWV